MAIGTDETRAAPAIPGDPADDGLDDPRLRDLRETQALPPDRRSVLLIGEPPPAAGAPVQERIAHQARETLRDTAHALVALDDGHPDRLAAHLFRSRLSTLYVDMREQLRQYAPRSDDDLPGEARHHRLLDVLGPLDRVLVESLDRWSAVLATGSRDALRYLDAARGAQEAVGAVLERMDRARDPGDRARPLYPGASRSSTGSRSPCGWRRWSSGWRRARSWPGGWRRPVTRWRGCGGDSPRCARTRSSSRSSATPAWAGPCWPHAHCARRTSMRSTGRRSRR
ncbi:hypothetical protein BJF90_12190 [Pseudonocardia sp. CNS-004]|nr:hypothetical protein BJF90_12190 [Pseudonocardia sp. CNS-004]